MAGSIITKEQADELFGEVLSSKSFTLEEFREYLSKCEKFFMIGFYNNSPVIAAEGRKFIYPESFELDQNEVLTVYSLEVINELILKSNDSSICIERRESHLTITKGGFTLQFGHFCPPDCL
jgi:hypothetical protein